jgi:hypothetical protein
MRQRIKLLAVLFVLALSGCGDRPTKTDHGHTDTTRSDVDLDVDIG